MKAAALIFPVLLLAVSVVSIPACSSETAKPVKTRAERQAAAEQKLATIAPPRRYAVDGGELLVLEVPVRDGLSVDFQRCFVWRDAGSSTISCPQPPQIVGGD